MSHLGKLESSVTRIGKTDNQTRSYSSLADYVTIT